MTELIAALVLCFASVALATMFAIRTTPQGWQRYQEAFVEKAQGNLSDMFMFLDADLLRKINIGCVFVLPLIAGAITGNLLVLIAVAIAAVVLPRKVYTMMRERRLAKLQVQLPDAMLMMASTMRAGLGFRPAMEALVQASSPPLSQEFGLVLREQRLGVKFEDAMDNLAQRVPLQDMGLLVAAVAISRDIGGNLAETLATLSETLRRKITMEGKIKSLTAQGKMQGIVMALLPVAMVTFLWVMYPETMGKIFHTPMGWGVIALGCVMEYMGYKMCAKIMSIDI